MAPKRRSTRKSSAAVVREASPAASELSALSDTPDETSDSKDLCPACSSQAGRAGLEDKETWIQCDKCKTWFHWHCVGDGGDHEALQKWYCRSCCEANPSLKPTLKPPARKSSRKRTQLDYANLHAGLDPTTSADGSKWIRIIETKLIKPHSFKSMKGTEVNIEWVEQDSDALKEPIIIEKPDGLGMRMPPKGFTVADVAEVVGSNTPVEVIDVATQSNTPNWNLAKWSEYYSQAPESRDKIRNVISLEFSNTPLAEKVSPPRIVKDLDWVEKFWPASKKGPGQGWPKVQMYCLMGVAQAWTDWHIDFAGSSVYYHIFKGSKIFYFIRPTPVNLAAYEKWSGTDLQTSTWLGDLVDEVVKVELVEGNTMIIPTGWIHAVYTPVDSLVFGGNFLHSWNIATQLRVRDIEIATHVPKKFRFPLFTKLCWYAGEKFLKDLKAREDFPQRILESISVLADFLVCEARIIEARAGQGAPSDMARKESKDAVPTDKVKDAPALARELRWRIRNALNVTSGDENSSKRAKSWQVSSNSTNGVKRKREEDDSTEFGETEHGRPIFRNWRRKGWDKEEFLPKRLETVTARRKRPYDNLQAWMKDATVDSDDLDTEEAIVDISTEVIIKVRKVRQSNSKDVILERQRVERRVEVYRWPERELKTSTGEEDEGTVHIEEENGAVPDTKMEEEGEGEGEGERNNADTDEMKEQESEEQERGNVDGASMVIDVQV